MTLKLVRIVQTLFLTFHVHFSVVYFLIYFRVYLIFYYLAMLKEKMVLILNRIKPTVKIIYLSRVSE